MMKYNHENKSIVDLSVVLVATSFRVINEHQQPETMLCNVS